MSTPLISILMPAYNCEKYIREAIDSILNQSHVNFELLIADDASTDGTKSIIESYTDARIKLHHNDRNLGYLMTSNKLISHCKGDFISFQDADDSCVNNRLELLLNEFGKNKELGCVGSFVSRINEAGAIQETISLKCSYNEIRADLPGFFNCVGSALMVKKEVIEKLGLYETYFDRIGSEDLYWYGIIVHQYETVNIPLALYNYRSTPNSISNELHKAPKKQMSHEIAINGLNYFYKTGNTIFKNTYRLRVLESYLIGKCLCWRKQYKEGIRLILSSIALNPFIYPERYALLKTYFPKLIK